MADFDRESMLEMFIFEMSQLIEQLEQTIIRSEAGFTPDDINEIFRIMHTIKGSSAMMKFDNMSSTAHSIEDMFYYLREENPTNVDASKVADIVLEGMDFIKVELDKVSEGSSPDGDGTSIINNIKAYLKVLKGDTGASAPTKESQKVASSSAETPAAKSDFVPGQNSPTGYYKAKIIFEEGCEMENVRSYTLVHNLGDMFSHVTYEPEDILSEDATEIIRKNGFNIKFKSELPYNEIQDSLLKTIYLKDLILEPMGDFNLFNVKVFFSQGSEMENVRAYNLIHILEQETQIVSYTPQNILDEETIEIIRKEGFVISFKTPLKFDDINNILKKVPYLRSFNLQIQEEEQKKPEVETKTKVETVSDEQDETSSTTIQASPSQAQASSAKKPPAQHMISVNVSKLDLLLNLMGELVIAEAMVTQNPDLDGLELESFHKETRQLRKIIKDVQDTVMSMRMVPLSTTFFKMQRLVRDMCKQLQKDVTLEVVGEETEVDKNIIEHISDPLMHIIRNSIDHGIEMPDERKAVGKSEKGTVLLEAKNSGGDVLIIIKDDGAGLNKKKIMEKAKNAGLLKKPETDYTDKEIHQFIFLPGFSTNEKVTNYSGRGVGMDVVSKNIELVGGSVLVDSIPNEGSMFTLKIPLTLAIIEGMTIKMGGAKYTIPIISIQKSFKVTKDQLFSDPDGNEMIRTSRGEVFNVVRLNEFFNINDGVTDVEEGIMITLENSDQTICLFVDELIGEQQVVVKTMPKYIKKIRGLSGCTLLGNGDISLIIDIAGFFDK